MVLMKMSTFAFQYDEHYCYIIVYVCVHWGRLILFSIVHTFF
jgi:hypothetical protein